MEWSDFLGLTTMKVPCHPSGAIPLWRERIWVRRKRKLSPSAMSRGPDFLVGEVDQQVRR